MNRMLLAAVVSVICVPLAFAQPAATRIVDAKLRGNSPNAKAPATGTTRVAVVNLGYILHKYDRATVLKEEMLAEVKKVGEEVTRLQEMVNAVQMNLQKGDFKNGTKEEYEEKLISGRRRLEDLNRLAQTKFGKATQAQLMTLWGDIREAVKDYCAQHSIELVMAYGEPLQKDANTVFQDVTRRIQAIDAGGSAPFFMAPGVDISESVTEFLNKRYRESKDNDN
jgi:Skp family chaperone for outer membrane proteins